MVHGPRVEGVFGGAQDPLGFYYVRHDGSNRRIHLLLADLGREDRFCDSLRAVQRLLHSVRTVHLLRHAEVPARRDRQSLLRLLCGPVRLLLEERALRIVRGKYNIK